MSSSAHRPRHIFTVPTNPKNKNKSATANLQNPSKRSHAHFISGCKLNVTATMPKPSAYLVQAMYFYSSIFVARAILSVKSGDAKIAYID